jgi:hypothetical protein
MAWAGLNPGEDEEALFRGSPQNFDNAVRRIVDNVVERDPAVVAASKIHTQRSGERSRLSKARTTLEHKTYEEEREVRRCEGALRELHEKIQVRDRNQAKKEVKAVSKEDQARFVEARRRIAAAANAGSVWDTTSGKIDKLDPPFVWPPKGK